MGDLGGRDIIALVILEGAEVRRRQKRWRVVYRPPIRYFAALIMTVEKFWWTVGDLGRRGIICPRHPARRRSAKAAEEMESRLQATNQVLRCAQYDNRTVLVDCRGLRSERHYFIVVGPKKRPPFWTVIGFLAESF
jgi:hypothetical protein